jgi:hypothetical protein
MVRISTWWATAAQANTQRTGSSARCQSGTATHRLTGVHECVWLRDMKATDSYSSVMVTRLGNPFRRKPNRKVNKFHFQKLLNENPYEVVKDGSTNPGATGAVEPYVAVSQVDSKTGEDAAGAETETDE